MFLASCACLLAGTTCIGKQTKQQSLRFVVISDTHFGSDRGDGATVKVPRALKNLLGKASQADAVFVVGDLTNRGTPEEYDLLISVFSDRTNIPEGVPVYFMGGFNHDKSAANDYEIYRDKVKQPLNQYIEIKGYPFITLTEGGSSHTAQDQIAPAVNAEAQRFLSEKLAEASRKYPGKPVFVFVHVPPLNTCYGSREVDGWGTDLLLPVLNRYPQAVVFSGHSHFPLGDPRSIHQGKFTSVNDGSLNYSEVEPGVVSEGIHPERFENINEGLIVNVDRNGTIEMERWDTYRNEEILPRWHVEAPHDGTRFVYANRNGLPAPVFAEGAKPEVARVTNDSITVSFPQAADNEVVHHYLIEIRDSGRVMASYSKFSQFYLNSRMPAKLTVGFAGLPAGKKFEIQVKAVDSYGNLSTPIVSK
ncbi:MAG: metallophosphoesterase [Tannerella sp.]|nr:metallophosphoesterase [Tannerella sp.]